MGPAAVGAVRTSVKTANAKAALDFPGDPTGRQPVHVVYGGAQIFAADTVRKLGDLALKSLRENAPDAVTFAEALGFGGDEAFARRVYERVVAKLEREAVEDYRIDFEDGFGVRPDAEEDRYAESTARETAKAMASGGLPAFFGIRIKPFSEELFARSARTLDLFVSTLAAETRGKLPANFTVTQPKLTSPAQVAALAKLLDGIEAKSRLRRGTVTIELMVETPQSVIAEDGTFALPRLVAAAKGRCVAAHFGTYDYTASMNVTAAHQHMLHPSCDFAKHAMQVSMAGRGIMLSDGATNVMPVGPHRGRPEELTDAQRAENRAVVHRAWKLAYDATRHSLIQGFYQGWDLHPAQLPVRYAAAYAFFLEGLAPASARLKAFMDKAAQATLLGDVFDDAATGQGLLNFFLRGVSCGAITEAETAATGLTQDEVRGRSFVKILAARKNAT